MMTISQYFNPYNDEAIKKLYKSLIDQCINMFGVETTYIARDSQSHVDLFFGDDPTKVFSNVYPIVVMIENVDQFDGGDLFTKFGYTVSKSVSLLLGTENFQEGTANNVGPRPREGDLVWLQPFQALYEIKYVNQDKFFYAFGNKNFYGWSLSCEEFRYNNENITTGIPDVDGKVNQIMIAYQAQMANGNGSYSIGEAVYQGTSYTDATSTAVVISWDLPTANLVLGQTVGVFIANTNVIGLESNAVFTLQSINVLDNVHDGLDNNEQIRQEADVFLNFNEDNPFGNPTE